MDEEVKNEFRQVYRKLKCKANCGNIDIQTLLSQLPTYSSNQNAIDSGAEIGSWYYRTSGGGFIAKVI